MEYKPKRNAHGEIEDYFRCSCHSPDHLLMVDVKEEMVSLYVLVQPTTLQNRIKQAFNMLLGKEQGCVQEFVWCNENDYAEMDKFIDTLKAARVEAYLYQGEEDKENAKDRNFNCNEV